MSTIKLALFAPILLLAACHSAPPPVVAQAHSVGPAQGIDMPTDASDALNEIKDSKIDFVARYYRSPTSRWPTLSAAEAQRLSALGLKIVSVWESHSHDPAYFTYAAGYDDAASAYRQAKTVGQPAGSAIYFAVDYNAPGADIAGPIQQYFRGVAAGFAKEGGGRPEYRVGVYGSGAVCSAIRRAGLAQYSWLSNSSAWAGSLAYNDWNIKQGGRFSSLSINHDANEARDEYGGFQLATSKVAPVVGAATAVATAAPVGAAAPATASTSVAAAASADIAGPVDVAASPEMTAAETSRNRLWPTIAAMFSL
ncbi:MAG TPA: DUF1906 domain-containing protein [Stellaceae bacterium]|nr:DUF1906 domain-containing protein [Stellaceae bacterium]